MKLLCYFKTKGMIYLQREEERDQYLGTFIIIDALDEGLPLKT